MLYSFRLILFHENLLMWRRGCAKKMLGLEMDCKGKSLYGEF